MGKYDFTNYKMNTKAAKASPILEHDFNPIKDDPEITVNCTYFMAGERSSFIELNEDGSATFNFRRIFEKKVRSISGLVVTITDEATGNPKDVEITDPKTLLAFPEGGIATDIINATARHLIRNDSLTEDEEGN